MRIEHGLGSLCTLTAGLGMAMCAQGADTVLTTSGVIAPTGRMYFSTEDKGSVSYDSSSGWYTYSPSTMVDDTTVTLTIEATNLSFRAYNQFWVEWDNANSSTAMRFSLLRALPVYDEVKADVVTAGSGKSETSKSLDGLGAPGRLRGIRAVFYHKTSSYATSVVTKQIRFRARLRLIDGSLMSNLWTPLSGAQSQPVAYSFSSSAKSAAESRRTSLKNVTASLKTTAQASGTSNANKIAAYESLFVHRDGDAREIEKAALAVEAKAHESKGKILYGCASSMDKIARDGVFAGTYGASLSISAARGETEAAQIVLYPSVAMSGVRAVVSTLVSESGASLDPSLLTVSPVGYVKPTCPAYVSPASMRDTIADPILEWADSLDLEPERFQPYWVEASIPEKTAPGVYSGSVTFTDSAGRSASVPLSVKVRRMSLSRHRRLPVVFSSNVFTASTGMQIAYERDAAVIGELADFFKSESGDPSSLSSRAFAAWTRAKRLYDMLVAHNLPYQNIYCSPSTVQPKWIRDMRLSDCPSLYTIGYDKVSPSVDVVGEHVAAMGDQSSSIWFYGYDEVSSASAYASMKKSFGSVKAAYPQVKTFCTALDGTFGETSDCLTEVDAWVDPEDRFSGSGHQANAAKARARGKQVWFYPCNWPVIPWANYHLENSGVANRVVTGAAAWKKKTDGVLYYSVDTPSPYVDTPIISGGFDSFVTGAAKTRLGNSGWDRDVTLTTSSSTTSTKAERWETFADGVDRLPAVRIRGQVYVNNFRKSGGWGCNVELRFNYVDKSLGDNGQEQNFYNVDVSKTKQWQTIDMTVTPKGEAVNCLFRVYAKSTSAKVIFRDVRVEYADGHTVNRKLGASGPLPRNTVVFENACYGSFRSNGDGSLVYPGPDGPSSSIRLKCVRDGIDDYEYLYMLSNAVLAVKSGRVLMPDASDFLSRAASAMSIPSDVCASFTSYADTGAPLVAWRDEIGDLVDEYLSMPVGEGASFALYDSAEKFSGESGASSDGYAGDDGRAAWSGAESIMSDDTAFEGGRYFRIADEDANQHNLRKVFPVDSIPSFPLADGEGIPFSFAFRRYPSSASDGSLSGCNITFGARAASIDKTTSTTGVDIFATPKSAWPEPPAEGRWYLVEGRLCCEAFTDRNGAPKNRIAYRADRIVDTELGVEVAGKDALSSAYTYVNVEPATDWTLTYVRFMTWSQSQAIVDIDAVRFGSSAPRCISKGPLKESFETFPRAYNTSIAGYHGDDGAGKWSVGQSAVVMTGDDGFAGEAYLRIADNTTSQHSATRSIIPAYRPRIMRPGERRCGFSFSFRRTPVDATSPLTGCKLKLYAVSPTTGERLDYSDGADIFKTPFSTADAQAENEVWYRVTGHISLETPSQDRRRLAYRVNSVRNLETSEVLYSDLGEGLLCSYKDAFSDADDFVLSGFTFFTFGASKGFIDLDDFSLGNRPPEGFMLRFR